MKIAIASDHRGFLLKQDLINNLKEEYELLDLGTYTEESGDYPDYAFKLGKEVSNGHADFGVAICGSGIGISIACNKVKGIRCAKVSNSKECVYTRNDNNSNIVAFSAEIPLEEAIDIVRTFVETPFSNLERHQNRIDKISLYEEGKYEC